MNEQLVQFGLSPKAAAIYLSLLESGPATVSVISSRTNINRTTLYDIIPSLIDDGLVTQIPNLKIEQFQAESPEKIPLLLESKINKLQQQLETAKLVSKDLTLLALSGQAGKPKVTIYEGTDGLKKMYEDSLLCKTHIRSFLSPESVESFDPSYVHNYFKRRAEKEILIKGLINNVPEAWEYIKNERKLKRDIRVVPKEMMNIKPEVYVYDDKIAFYSIKERFGVLIESNDMADAIKKLYDLAWEQAKGWNTKLRNEKSI